MDVQLDLGSPIANFLGSVFAFLGGILSFVFYAALAVFILFELGFFISVRLAPWRLTYRRLLKLKTRFKWFDLQRWLMVDFICRNRHKNDFRDFGLTIYTGKQGRGKTCSMVHYLALMKRRYPDCIIVSNFKCKFADHIMCDWDDFLHIRNGSQGVIFAIDEIHSEYSAANYRDVPEVLLAEISQQRKQRIKVVATAQYYTRIVKAIREQARDVVVCKTWLGRYVRLRYYAAEEYDLISDNPLLAKKKLKPIRKQSYIMSNDLRKSYDTYAKVERMARIETGKRKRGEVSAPLQQS